MGLRDTAALVADVRRRLPSGPTDAVSVARVVRDELPVVDSRTVLDAARAVTADILGAGVLEPLLRDPAVSDVLVNGPGPVWVDRGSGVERTDLVVTDEPTLRRLAQRLVAACGRRLDDAVPHADARLPDGTRVHAVLPPISVQGTCLSLRVPPRRAFDLDELVTREALPAAGAAVLRRIVQARL